MQIVINLTKQEYEKIKQRAICAEACGFSVNPFIQKILNGIVLPKGHGRLIDASQLLTVTECREDGTEYCYVPYTCIEDAPTIIEADREIEK